MEIGVQSKNIILDENPREGMKILSEIGFNCIDFSLNEYLTNRMLYQDRKTNFFDKSIDELKEYFTPHKQAAEEFGIRFHQAHMPYPNFVPGAPDELNEYLWKEVAPKTLKLCAFMGIKYVVIHGTKLVNYYGTEEAEWNKTKEFIESIAPLAKELNITICMENIYTSRGDGHIAEGPCCNAAKAARRIDEINEKFGAEVLGFCFDTGHANLVGINFEKFLTIIGPRLKVLHMHDNEGIHDLHQIPFAYTRSRDNKSSTDWNGFITAMKKNGFDDVLNFETAPVLDAFPDELKKDALQMIYKTGKYFENKIKE